MVLKNVEPMAPVARLLVIAATILVAVPAFAADTARLATLEGTCRSMVAGMNSGPAPRCKNTVLNMDFPNGRNGFVFFGTTVDQKTVAIGFFGNSDQQTHETPDVAIQQVDRIDLTFETKMDPIQATGSCRFSNPYKGVAVVSCTAETQHGTFVGDFTSDGYPPRMGELPVK